MKTLSKSEKTKISGSFSELDFYFDGVLTDSTYYLWKKYAKDFKTQVFNDGFTTHSINWDNEIISKLSISIFNFNTSTLENNFQNALFLEFLKIQKDFKNFETLSLEEKILFLLALNATTCKILASENYKIQKISFLELIDFCIELQNKILTDLNNYTKIEVVQALNTLQGENLLHLFTFHSFKEFGFMLQFSLLWENHNPQAKEVYLKCFKNYFELICINIQISNFLIPKNVFALKDEKIEKLQTLEFKNLDFSDMFTKLTDFVKTEFETANAHPYFMASLFTLVREFKTNEYKQPNYYAWNQFVETLKTLKPEYLYACLELQGFED